MVKRGLKYIENKSTKSVDCNPTNLGRKATRKTQIKRSSPPFWPQKHLKFHFSSYLISLSLIYVGIKVKIIKNFFSFSFASQTKDYFFIFSFPSHFQTYTNEVFSFPFILLSFPFTYTMFGKTKGKGKEGREGRGEGREMINFFISLVWFVMKK